MPLSNEKNHLNLENFQLSVWYGCGKLEIQFRPERDGSTSLGRLLFDSSLNWGGGTQPAACHHLHYPSFSQPEQGCGELQARLSAAAWESKPGLGPIRAGWVAAEVTTHAAREQKGCTLLPCESGVTLRLPVLPAKASTKTIVSKDSLPSSYTEAQPYFLYCQNVRKTSWHNSTSEIWQLALE